MRTNGVTTAQPPATIGQVDEAGSLLEKGNASHKVVDVKLV